MPDDQPEPLTPLAQRASELLEIFSTYLAVGFTEQQALYLVGQVLTAMIRSN